MKTKPLVETVGGRMATAINVEDLVIGLEEDGFVPVYSRGGRGTDWISKRSSERGDGVVGVLGGSSFVVISRADGGMRAGVATPASG